MICICYESCGLIWNIRATRVWIHNWDHRLVVFNMNWAWDSVGKTAAPEGTDLDDQVWRATQLRLIHLAPSPIRIQIMKHSYFTSSDPQPDSHSDISDIRSGILSHLVGGWPTPLKNDGRIVSWDDFSIPNWMESHIAAMFQTTNQPHSILASFLASILTCGSRSRRHPPAKAPRP